MTDARQAIEHLIFTYARSVDQADFAALGAMFEHATVSANTSDDTARGGAAIAALWSGVNEVHPDGTLRTRHLVTNLDLDLDEAGDRASVDSYRMVFQQTERLPLQPNAGGRYRDTFVRVDGVWRYESPPGRPRCTSRWSLTSPSTSTPPARRLPCPAVCSAGSATAGPDRVSRG